MLELNRDREGAVTELVEAPMEEERFGFEACVEIDWERDSEEFPVKTVTMLGEPDTLTPELPAKVPRLTLASPTLALG